MAWTKEPIAFARTATDLELDIAAATSVNIRYMPDTVADSSLPDYFRNALAYQLASHVVESLMGINAEAKTQFAQIAEAKLNQAIALDMQQEGRYFSGNDIVGAALHTLSDVVNPSSDTWNRLYANLTNRYDDLFDSFLQMYPWNFAVTRSALTLDAQADSEYPYSKAISSLSNPLYILYVTKLSNDDKLVPYAVENGNLQTHDATVQVVYVLSNKAETDMPAVIREAFIAYLALQASLSFSQAEVEEQGDGAVGQLKMALYGRAKAHFNSAYKAAREFEKATSSATRLLSEVVNQTLLLLGYDSSLSIYSYYRDLYKILSRYEQARDYLLTDHPWIFAQEHVNLTATTASSGTLTVGKRYKITTFVTGDDFTNVGASANTEGTIFVATGTTPTTWTNSSVLTLWGEVEYDYEFTLPCDCLYVQEVATDYNYTKLVGYALEEDRKLLCDDPDVWVTYTKRVLDEAKFSAGFKEALAHYLAWSVSMVIHPGNERLQKDLYQRYLDVAARAKDQDERSKSAAHKYRIHQRRAQTVGNDAYGAADAAQYGDDWFENARINNPSLDD